MGEVRYGGGDGGGEGVEVEVDEGMRKLVFEKDVAERESEREGEERSERGRGLVDEWLGATSGMSNGEGKGKGKAREVVV